MGTYQRQSDFIKRTKEIFENGHKYEKTLLLNCCVGLLIMPQQSLHRKKISINGNVNEDDWGIVETDIKCNKPKPTTTLLSIDNIAYHFRNSIAHYRFDIFECNKGKTNIEKVHIRDFYPKNNPTFDLEMSFENFQKFVLKYSDELQKKLHNL